jgi:integrase
VERIGSTALALVSPKSKKSIGRVEIQPSLVALLAAVRDRQNGPEYPFVFQSEIGGPIDPDSVYDVLHTAQDEAGVRRFGVHGLRHLYNSLPAESGAGVKFMQEKMGHMSSTTTLNIYAHVISDKAREYPAKVEAAFPCVSLTLAKPAQNDSKPEMVN